MDAKSRRPLAEMLTAAAAFCTELAPYVERIEIGGSVRRCAPLCADIELLCIPKIETERDPADLFRSITINRLDGYCRSQLDAGRYRHRLSSVGSPAFGERYKRLLVDDVPLDLFSVLHPASWGVLMLIRTGSAAFSQRAVTTRSAGGLLPDGYRVQNGAVWRGDTRIELPEERDYFALCGLRYVEPEQR